MDDVGLEFDLGFAEEFHSVEKWARPLMSATADQPAAALKVRAVAATGRRQGGAKWKMALLFRPCVALPANLAVATAPSLKNQRLVVACEARVSTKSEWTYMKFEARPARTVLSPAIGLLKLKLVTDVEKVNGRS